MPLDAALDESREMLKAIVDATTAVIYVKDLDGRYVLINRRFEELFHIFNDAAQNKSDHAIFPKAIADRFRANDLNVQRERVAVEFEEHVPHDDGEHIYISLKFPLVRRSGEMYAVCGISTDITARKRAETELAATKASLERLVDERTADLRQANERLTAEVAERVAAVERLQRLIDTAREGIWVLDAAGRTTFVNARLAEMLGYTPDEMIGRLFYDFMDEARRDDAAGNLERRRQGIAEDLDYELRRKDGSNVWVLLATNPILDQDGRMVGALAVLTDITERKRAEQQQRLLLRELDHRVKNTLASVLALSDLTLERATSLEEFRRAFDGRVQAMARTHEALSRARWKDVSFDEVVAIVLAPLAAIDATRIVTRGETLRVAATATTPLALALNELGTNALKHGALSQAGGGVTIEWDVAPGGEFRLSWTEHDGPRATAPSSGGTGLRLIRGLIEHELEGRVLIEFAPEGLSCRITIPAATIAGVNG
jgi:PAS domain S-box-containing protein